MKKYLYFVKFKVKYLWLKLIANSIYFWAMLKFFCKKHILPNLGLFILIFAASAFAAYNYTQYCQSFDRCEDLITEIHSNLAILESEINSLNSAL